MYTENLGEYGLSVIMLAVSACILTSLFKLLWKKLLVSSQESKSYSDKLSELCFLTETLLSFALAGLYFLLSGTENFSASRFVTLSLSTISCSELIYTLYESIGLKSLVKLILQRLKQL